MLNEGRVVQSSDRVMGDQQIAVATFGRAGELLVADARARYYDAVKRGNVYFASNQAGIAAGAGIATASKNWNLHNPAGSGKNLALLELSIGITVAPVAEVGAIFLVATFPTQAAPGTVTAETVQNAMLAGSGANAVAKVYNTATLATSPVIIRTLGSWQWVSAAGFGTFVMKDEVAGALVLPPGAVIAIQATAAVTMQCSGAWEEVPIG